MKGKKLFNKIAATGMTVAMVAAMGMPVFAEDADNVVTSAGSATISKEVYTAQNGEVKVPAGTYTFAFANKNNDDKLNISNKTVTLDSATAGNDGKLELKTNAILTSAESKALTDKGVGIYTYVLTEGTPTLTDKSVTIDPVSTSTADKILRTDPTAYLIRIKVVNDSQGTRISGITAEKFASAEEANSANTATDGNKVATITFNNKYTEYGNSTTNTTNGLSISKSVTNSEDENIDSKNFNYTITFTEDTTKYASANDGINNTTNTYVNDGLGISASKAVTNSTTNASATVLSYGTYKFTLHNDETINFKVPAGTKYTVTETGESGYTASYTVTTNGTAASQVKSETAGTDASTGDQYVTTGANSVAFVNDAASNPLTGIVNNYGGLIAVVAIAAVGIVFVMVRRRREV